ncbi:squamosa promoter-binding-like protein 7, partial [Selaginella moellendorffii]
RRRRDPRLSCPNFLAGRVPCACSDEEDEEEAERSKKRSKLSSARCQVPACHADLTPLKGYHQRHRVCLTCANATSVWVRGQDQRYCQQCGKFHPLGDFDEGKRSCRRKLERHNDRRRRKLPESGDTSVVSDKHGTAPNTTTNSDVSDVQQGVAGGGGAPSANDLYCLRSHAQRLLQGSKPPHHEGDDDSFGVDTSVASGEESLLAMLLEEQQEQHNNQSMSTTSGFPKRTTYTSPCPTRRISFKFYDWNPADFPRRLRGQIMEWLANMPVELEGYIRSGCTILTLFIAMPQSLWAKLEEDWNDYLAKLTTGAETGFWDKGFVLAFLGNQVAYIHNGSVSSPSLCERATKKYPVIEAVFPLCVEAGTEATVTLTGHNLLKLNSRVLVASRGKYLPCCIRASSHFYTSIQIDVLVPQGPGVAFVEIGYDHGISNSVPLLVADKQLCEEVQTLERDLKASSSGCCSGRDACRLETHEVLVDLGWVISHTSRAKRVSATPMHVCRLQRLLVFAVERGWTAATKRILEAARQMGQSDGVGIEKALQAAVAHNRADIIKVLLLYQGKREACLDEGFADGPAAATLGRLCSTRLLHSSSLRYKRRTIVKVAVGLAVACAGICLVVQHPRQVFHISTSLRRCLWYKP